MNVVTKRFVSLSIGIILLLIALVLNNLGLLRAMLAILSIIILTYSFQLERNNKKVFIPLFIILFTFFVIALDFLVVSAFKKTPIMSYSIVSTSSGTVYNALGYRVWSCKDKTFKVDPLYKLGYYCEKESMTAESINNVLTTIVNNFEDYQDNYVKIVGRVTKVIDDKSFYMEMYKENDNLVSFDTTYRLYVEFNYSDSSILSLNDTKLVTVIGKISKKDGNYVYMIDSSYTSEITHQGDVSFDAESNIYCEYDKELWFQTSDNIFYKSCIDDVNISINNAKYNLQYVLKNNFLTLEQIKNEALGFESQSKDNSIMYNFKDFKILVCDPNSSKDVIVGRLTMDFSDGYCNNIESNRGV